MTKRTATRKNRVERKRIAMVITNHLVNPSLSKLEYNKLVSQFRRLAALKRGAN